MELMKKLLDYYRIEFREFIENLNSDMEYEIMYIDNSHIILSSHVTKWFTKYVEYLRYFNKEGMGSNPTLKAKLSSC